MSRRVLAVRFLQMTFLGFILLSTQNLSGQGIPEELIQYPETIFHNGTVLTVDTDQGDFTSAEAIAIRSGRVLAVGSNSKILSLEGSQTRKIDLGGKTIMPGIIDTHIHPNRYAISHYFEEIPERYQKLLRSLGVIREWKSKDQVLSDIRDIVTSALQADPSLEWLLISSRVAGVNEVARSITLQDLDAISPDKPLLISFAANNGMVNSKVLEKAQTYYGSHLPGMVQDSAGAPTGHVKAQGFYLLRAELMPQIPAEVLAPIFRKELIEHLAPLGHTTFSSRLDANQTRAYILLDLQGQMPMRLAFGHEVGRLNPYFERDMRRGVAALPGYGTDRVWLNAISVGIPDIAIRDGGWAICSTFPKLKPLPDDIYKDGLCFWEDPEDPTEATIEELTRLGFRVANIHTYGDKGLELAVDLFGKLGVGGRRFALDHAVMLNEKVIRESGKLGIYWSVASQKYGEQKQLAGVYGREVIDRYTYPLKELLDGGAKVTYEASARGANGEDTTTPFYDMEIFVTRKDSEGNIWGIRNALDRKTVLRMMTRWGAEYVLKEDKIGSLEPGKYADLIILDKNPLDPNLPDEELSEIKILSTMVEGEAIFKLPGSGL